MITESMVYWILKLDNIVDMFVILAIISILSSVITLGIWFVKRDDCYNNENLDKYVKISVISFALFIVFLMMSTFIPSTKQMAIIKIVPIIAKGEITKEIKGDAKEIYKLGVRAIKESLITKDKEE
jgi:hypothetical protein